MEDPVRSSRYSFFLAIGSDESGWHPGMRIMSTFLAFIVAIGVVIVLDPSEASAAPSPEVTAAQRLGPAEAADVDSARVTARLQNRRIEALSERTETETTWVNPDGSQTTELNAGPIRVQREGGWVPLNLDLVAGADGKVRPGAHPRGLVLAGAGGQDGKAQDLAAVAGAAGEVAVQYPGTLPAPVLEGNVATYPDVRPGVDLQVKATRTGFEQFFVVKSRPAAGDLTFTLPIRAKGVQTRADADGNTQIIDDSGEVIGSLPGPMMWDARVDEASGSPATVKKIGTLTLDKPSGRAPPQTEQQRSQPSAPGQGVAGTGVVAATVTADAAFLADPARQYPVTIDPGITIWTNFDTFTQSNIANTDQSGQTELRLGTYDGGTTKARSYLHFDVSRFRGNKVLQSNLNLYAIHSSGCQPRNWEVWDTALVGTGTRWSNQPNPYTRWAVSNVTRGNNACGPTWTQTDVTRLLDYWASINVATGSMVLKAENESDTLGWKKFSSAEGGATPHLTVTYNTRPKPATGLNVSDRGGTNSAVYTRSLTPTLSFTPVDPDGDAVTAAFYIYEGDTLIADYWRSGVPSGSVAQWKVPAGLLQEGKTYRFRATTIDGSRNIADDGWVALRSERSGQFADVGGCAKTNGSPINQWPGNGAECQKFFPWGTGDGFYQFRVRHSGQVIDNTNCATANGNPISTYDQVNGDCQKWRIERQGATNGIYKFAVKNANKVLDQSCSTTNGTRLVIWERVSNNCQTWKMVLSPYAGATVQWLNFTVDTTAPGAPLVTSSDYPADGSWNKGAGQAGSFTFTRPSNSPDVTGFVYGLDTTPATEVAANSSGVGTASITPPTDGSHVLNVRSKDRAGNLSAVVAWRFNVGRAGLLQPTESQRTVSRLPIQVQAPPELTHVKFLWRRGPGAAIEADIPTPHLRRGDGAPMDPGFVPVASLGGPAPGGLAVWTATDTLGSVTGVVQVKAILATDAQGTNPYSTAWQTAIVDPDADGAEAEDIGGASLNLLTGDLSQSSTDAEEFGLSVTRSASSRDPRAGYQPQRERLTVNQQKISTDTTGFTPTASTLARVTDRGHESTESLQITPLATGTGTDTFAAIEADAGAMRLGMRAGRLYRVSGWMYVPAATGINPPDPRGQTITLVIKNAAGAYQAISTPKPTVTDAWVEVKADVPIPAGATEAFIRLYNGHAPGSGKSILVDDLSVRELVAPFGPQWLGGTSVEAADIAYSRLTVDLDNVVQIDGVDGGKLWFTRAANGTYFPEPGAEDLTLTQQGTTFVLADTDGTLTTFDRAANTGPYLVSSTAPPIQAATTRYVYETVDDVVRVRRVIAPAETGIGDCATTTPARGCEALEYSYATATTAAPGQLGDTAGQIRAVAAWTTNPANGTMEKIDVARYNYDEFGRLREAWDPRLPQPIKTFYSYDADGRVTSAASTGELPWSYDYGAAGTLGISPVPDTNPGRLLKVHRPSLVPGTTDQLDDEIATTIVYNVPLTRGDGGPYDLDGPSAAAWSQADLPTDATAVFGPEDPTNTPTATSSSPGPDGYAAATVHYLNPAAREVNTATPGGYIDTTEYDRFGNTTRVLEASNRALALGQLPDSDAKLADLGLAQYDTRTRATWLDTQSTYSGDGTDLLTTLAPLQRLAFNADPDELVNARAQIVNTYDEGKPDGTNYHLITTQRSGAQVVGMTGLQDVRVTKTSYDATLGGVSGWAMRSATSTILDAEGPSGAPLTTQVKLDDRGRAVESRKIDATGTDAGTTKAVFYSAGANSADAACGNRPEWAGSPCLSTVGGAVTGHDAARMTSTLPSKRVESYNRFGEADRISETVDGKTRTTITTFDAADRITAVELTGDIGTPIGKVTTSYDPVTGDATTTSLPDGSTITRGYDLLGRVRSYTDADGATTTTEFDKFGKPAKVTDSIGTTQEFTYDRTVDPRGLLTSMIDSVAGTFTARYGPDGQLLEQGLPGGIRMLSTQDPAGDVTGRTYVRSNDAMIVASSNSVENLRGETISLTGPGSSKTFTYDRWGRLTSATQASLSTSACTIRDYTYDRRSNRTGKTTRIGSSAGVCPASGDTAQSETHTYDSADRITDAGYIYDAFGRITDTPSGLASSYYTNDLVASQQQGDQRMSWSLDPGHRFRQITGERNVNGAWLNNYTKINHYGADNDEPRWIAEDITQPENLTRNIEGPDGDLAATTGIDGNITLQLLSLHGDVMTTLPVDSAGTSGAATVLDSDEFGTPSSDTPAAVTARYSWLGGKQRSSETLGDTVLMGARVYDPASGRFFQVDPEPGGNATAYDYCSGDPVNCTDLDGRWSWRSAFRSVARVAAQVGELASWIPGPIGVIGAGVAAGAYAATGNWRKAGEMALVGAANFVGGGAAVRIGLRVVKASAKWGRKVGSGATRRFRPAARSCRLPNSFSPETRVLMADGTTLPISAVQIGDLVASSDPVTGASAVEPVVNVISGHGEKNLVSLAVAGAVRPIIATQEHPIWIDERGWVSAGEVRAGDLASGHRVTSVSQLGIRPNIAVFNLTVNGFHTFTVTSGIIHLTVHNSRGCPVSQSGVRTRQARLRQIAHDPQTPKHIKATLQRQIRLKKRLNVPGYILAHSRTHEAARGCGYQCAQLQTVADHKAQHRFDNMGKAYKGKKRIRRR